MLTVKNEIKKKVLQYCYERDDVDDAELLEIIDKFITEISRDKYYGIKDRQFLRKEVFNSLRRLDLLQELIDDKSITEIMVNGIYDIFIERKGRLSRYDRVFESQERLEDVVQQIVASCNRLINEAHGAKYYYCGSCCNDTLPAPEDTVYVTTDGRNYHININCGGLKRTIKAINRSEVGSRSQCKTCKIN